MVVISPQIGNPLNVQQQKNLALQQKQLGTQNNKPQGQINPQNPKLQQAPASSPFVPQQQPFLSTNKNTSTNFNNSGNQPQNIAPQKSPTGNPLNVQQQKQSTTNFNNIVSRAPQVVPQQPQNQTGQNNPQNQNINPVNSPFNQKSSANPLINTQQQLGSQAGQQDLNSHPPQPSLPLTQVINGQTMTKNENGIWTPVTNQQSVDQVPSLITPSSVLKSPFPQPQTDPNNPQQPQVDLGQFSDSKFSDYLNTNLNHLDSLTNDLTTISQQQIGTSQQNSQAMIASLQRQKENYQQERDAAVSQTDTNAQKLQEAAKMQVDVDQKANDLNYALQKSSYDQQIAVAMDNNSRLVGYMSGKLAASGMSDSSAGLEMIAKYMTTSQMSLNQLDIQASAAQQQYINNNQQILSSYFKQATDIENSRISSDNQVTFQMADNIEKIQQDQLASSQAQNQMVLSTLKDLTNTKISVAQTAQKNIMDVANLHMDQMKFNHQVSYDAVQQNLATRGVDLQESEFGWNKQYQSSQLALSQRQEAFNETSVTNQFGLAQRQEAFNEAHVGDWTRQFDPSTGTYGYYNSKTNEMRSPGQMQQAGLMGGSQNAPTSYSYTDQHPTAVAGSFTPAKGAITPTPDGSVKIVPPSYKPQQCGHLVNSITGLGFKDSYESKIAKCDPKIKISQPGDVFVMAIKGSPYGHTGFVLKNGVDAKGNPVQGGKYTTVFDANWDNRGTVKTHQILTSSFSGFARPKLPESNKALVQASMINTINGAMNGRGNVSLNPEGKFTTKNDLPDQANQQSTQQPQTEQQLQADIKSLNKEHDLLKKGGDWGSTNEGVNQSLYNLENIRNQKEQQLAQIQSKQLAQNQQAQQQQIQTEQQPAAVQSYNPQQHEDAFSNIPGTQNWSDQAKQQLSYYGDLAIKTGQQPNTGDPVYDQMIGRYIMGKTGGMGVIPVADRQNILSLSDKLSNSPEVKAFQNAKIALHTIQNIGDNAADTERLLQAYGSILNPDADISKPAAIEAVKEGLESKLSQYGVNISNWITPNGGISPEAKAQVKAALQDTYNSRLKDYSQAYNDLAGQIRQAYPQVTDVSQWLPDLSGQIQEKKAQAKAQGIPQDQLNEYLSNYQLGQ